MIQNTRGMGKLAIPLPKCDDTESFDQGDSNADIS
jgi:hypothetical protein